MDHACGLMLSVSLSSCASCSLDGPSQLLGPNELYSTVVVVVVAIVVVVVVDVVGVSSWVCW